MVLNRAIAYLKKHWDIVLYILFGGVTTAVNFAVYFPLLNHYHLSGALSNGISWFFAVLAAFLTNKPFVFHSNDWSLKTVVPEALRFYGCRFFSGVCETLAILITVDMLNWNGNVMKAVTSIFVIVVNYIASKWFVFKHDKQS